MYKETVICIITIILIIILNFITENYTKESVSELTYELSNLKEIISEDNMKDEQIQSKINDIYDKWNKRYDILAYYLEHDELEKVENNLTSLRSAVETEDYSEAISEVDEATFIMKHIERKNSFDLKNIF